MRLWSLIAVLGVFPSPGNGQSIHPFCEAKHIAFKTELVGKWDLEGVTLEFSKVGENAYGITMLGDNGIVIRFRAHLIRLGGKYFLDGQVSGLDASQGDAGEGKNKGQTRRDGPNEGFVLDESDILLNRHHGLILVEFT